MAGAPVRCKCLGTRIAVLPVLFYTWIAALWTDQLKPILEFEGMGNKGRRERQPQQQRDSEEGHQRSSALIEATAQRRVIAWIKPHLKPLLTHLLAVVLGSGAVWQYFQLGIQRENQANDIRKEIIILQEKLIQVTNSMNEAKSISSGIALDEKLRPLNRSLDFFLEKYNEWEAQLAKIEGRPPKQLDVTPPTPPHSFTVK